MKKEQSVLIPLLFLLTQSALAQNQSPGANQSLFEDFVSGFEEVALPFQLDPPVSKSEAYPLVTDRRRVEDFIRPHGLAHNTEVRAGHVIYKGPAFIALTVLISLNEEHAWYIITFSLEGEALDKGRIAAYSDNEIFRYRSVMDGVSVFCIMRRRVALP